MVRCRDSFRTTRSNAHSDHRKTSHRSVSVSAVFQAVSIRTNYLHPSHRSSLCTKRQRNEAGVSFQFIMALAMTLDRKVMLSGQDVGRLHSHGHSTTARDLWKVMDLICKLVQLPDRVLRLLRILPCRLISILAKPRNMRWKKVDKPIFHLRSPIRVPGEAPSALLSSRFFRTMPSPIHHKCQTSQTRLQRVPGGRARGPAYSVLVEAMPTVQLITSKTRRISLHNFGRQPSRLHPPTKRHPT